MAELSRLLTDGLQLLKERRHAELLRRAWRRLSYLLPLSPPPLTSITPFAAWVAQNSWTDRARLGLLNRLANLPAPYPRMLVVVDGTENPLEATARTLSSLHLQVYPQWEAVCVVDHQSDTASALGEGADGSAIRTVARRSDETLGQVLNRAVAAGQYDILLFFWAGDTLPAAALGEIAIEFALNSQTDWVYCDDDAIDPTGLRASARFKSAWTPEQILWPRASAEMIVVSRRLFEDVGGFAAHADGDPYGEFKLRAAALARRCAGIPLILHHRELRATSPARVFLPRRKEILDVAVKGVELDFREEPDAAIRIWVKSDPGLRVAVVLWGAWDPGALDCAPSKLDKFPVGTKEVYVVGPRSQSLGTGVTMSSISFLTDMTVPAAVNAVAHTSSAEFVLLLHVNTHLPDDDWLNQLVGALTFPGADVAGLFKVDDEGRVLESHLGSSERTDSSVRYPLEWSDDRSLGATPCLMLSACCLLTRRATLLKLDGLDAEAFPNDLADADYCVRTGAAGFRVIHLPVPGALPPVSSTPINLGASLAFRSRHRRVRDPWLNPSLREQHGRTALVPRRVTRNRPPTFNALFFSHTLSMEGAPFSQYELARHLKQTGVLNPQVISPSDGPIAHLYRQDDIRVHIEPRLRPRDWAPRAIDLAVEVASKLIETNGAAVVHANTLTTFPAIEAAYRRRCPSLWNPRESESWDKFYRFLDRGQIPRALSCFRYPYRVVFVAQATLDVWSGFDTQRNFMLIRNGLDLSRLSEAGESLSRTDARRSLNIRDDEIMVLSIGTICTRKGQRDIPAALRKLPASLASRMKVYMVGDEPSPYSTALHQDIERLPDAWNSRIFVLETAPNVGRFYRAADLFLLNSRAESYPRVLLEAMAFQLPIIATPVFGVREQVMEDVNGVFYPPGDAQALASRLSELVDEPGRLLALAAGSGPVLRSLPTFEEMAEQYSTIFREAFYTI